MKKVLIICAGLEIGGAEKVAADICLNAPKDEFSFDYLIFEGLGEPVYDKSIIERGDRVLCWDSPSCGYRRYIKKLGELIDENRYCAVHSHTMFNSGINLAVAKRHGVPCRIAHSHTTKTETRVSLMQRVYQAIMRICILLCATSLFACGEAAGNWLFGKRAFSRKGQLIRNGIDTEKFAYSADSRSRIRRSLGIGGGDRIIGHSGTIIPLKNQIFLVGLMPEIRSKIPDAKLVLLGAGEDGDISLVKNEISRLGLEDCVIMTGGVMNVNEYLSAFDVFAFPSLREGTPLALIEAQANGLPCVVSDCVPKDAFITELAAAVSLEDREKWTELLGTLLRRDPEKYRSAVADLGYDSGKTYERIYGEYRRLSSKPMISLSFDDGRGDNYDVAKNILIPMNIPATFNITSGYVDGTSPREKCPCENEAMTVEQIKELSDIGLIEMALHGNDHLNTPEDVAEGRRKMMSWLGISGPWKPGFASPGCGFNKNRTELLNSEVFKNDVSYIRVGMNVSTLKPLRILCRKASRVIHSRLLYKFAYAETLLSEPARIICSVPVMQDVTAEQVCAIVDLCVKKNKSAVFMLHSIDNSGKPWSWSEEKFNKLCRHIDTLRGQGKLEAVTTAGLYMRLNGLKNND